MELLFKNILACKVRRFPTYESIKIFKKFLTFFFSSREEKRNIAHRINTWKE